MKQLLVSLVFATSLVVSPGCKVQLAPSYDLELRNQVNDAAKMTDALYLEMIAATDKSFVTYAAKYAAVEAEINSILIKEMARIKNQLIIDQTNMLKAKFLEYQADHKTRGKLNAAELQIYNGLLQGFWQSIKNSEKFLE